MVASNAPTAPADAEVIGPQPGPQTDFLTSSADIVVYGGAAGGGKTFGLLLEPLRHLSNPLFRATIFRRTSPMIEAPGGLIDESGGLYPKVGGQFNQRRLEWSFPGMEQDLGHNCGKIRFAHMQYDSDRLNWQGAQIAMIGFDELTHFTETQFFYMLSRNRSASGVIPYVRATTNPDAESWVKTFIAPWVDLEWQEKTGISAEPGEILWFIRLDGEIVWITSEEEAQEYYDDDSLAATPKTITFIPANLSDNPALTKKDPNYLANLQALPAVERARLLDSDWDVVQAEGDVFDRDDFHIIDAPPMPMVNQVRWWDLASSKPTSSRKRPDWTVGLKMGRDAMNNTYILDVQRLQERPAKVEQIVKRTAIRDGILTPVKIEQEPGSSGVITVDHYVRNVLYGHNVEGIRSTGDKMQRARPFAAQVGNGTVFLIRGPWNEALLREYDTFPNAPNDDQVDSGSGAFSVLADSAGRWDEAFEQRATRHEARSTHIPKASLARNKRF